MSLELGQSAVESRSKIQRSGYCSRKGIRWVLGAWVPALRAVFISVIPRSPEAWAAFPLSIGEETGAQTGSGLSLMVSLLQERWPRLWGALLDGQVGS